jgi:ABC-type antimicrobial peptide transport system permease subunit
VADDLRHRGAEVDARVPIAGVTTLTSQVEDSMDRERLLTQLVGTFGLLALVLACVGLYGVVSQAVARRTGEVGIRMALGADRRDILFMVLGEVGWLILVGVAIGIPGAILASALVRNQLFGVAPADPLTLAGSALLLVSVAIAAGYIPARRAARIDPNVALRAE